ncbi:hypothetical protein ACFSC4_15195 [Deinococcus malanensis]|uniref:hypothetical protein n=1 Tax=Deinococcus malanensis TaxID=1706855 RepID=UPI00362D623C
MHASVGRHAARLEATLYVCRKQQRVCSRQQLSLQVSARASAAPALTITDEHLRRTSTWLPGTGLRAR